jgi:hypothetical protein
VLDVADALAEVEDLLATVQPRLAEERVHELLARLGGDELRTWEPDLRRTIDVFLPKRRKVLLSELQTSIETGFVPYDPDAQPAAGADVDLGELQASFSEALDDLRRHHIFQWATFYRDCLSQYFDLCFDADRRADDPIVVPTMLSDSVAEHAKAIFEQGYEHITRVGDAHEYAIRKSLNGLQRFLDLPIEFYSAKLKLSMDKASAASLRLLSSAMILGILRGYCLVRFSSESGGEALTQGARAWAHVLPFLTSTHLAQLTRMLMVGEFSDGLETAVEPLVAAIDQLGRQAGDYVPLPVLSQYRSDARRLDVSLKPPPFASSPQLVEVQSHLDAASVGKDVLDEALGRNVALLITPLRPDVASYVASSDRLRRLVVVAGDPSDSRMVTGRAVTALEAAIYERRSPRFGRQPLQYNFAQQFPLTNPFLTLYYRVVRSSVRDLLRTFEGRNGARLWCSVRRSGKTTACRDLSSTAGDSTIVTQTCDSTGQIPGENLFYDTVSRALADGSVVDERFFLDTVARCAPSAYSPGERLVFVLDEYETMFGRIRTALDVDPAVRYTVVQPLLNQMVTFTASNLLVFLGQQPNSHFILMDQNQLSPYVQQDPFPLFRHSQETLQGEFPELLRKVLTDRIGFDQTFANAIFQETAGHPFLTVNLLADLVDWLIECQRPANSLALTADDAEAFVEARLTRARISVSREYRFFREAMAEATSVVGLRHTPWLHAIYSCLREMGDDPPGVSRTDFDSVVAQLGLEEQRLSADVVLSTGMQSNFLEYDGDVVSPKIRLLGRIAAASRPRLQP